MSHSETSLLAKTPPARDIEAYFCESAVSGVDKQPGPRGVAKIGVLAAIVDAAAALRGSESAAHCGIRRRSGRL